MRKRDQTTQEMLCDMGEPDAVMHLTILSDGTVKPLKPEEQYPELEVKGPDEEDIKARLVKEVSKSEISVRVMKRNTTYSSTLM